MRVKHWSRRSSPVAWTTAIICFLASRKDWWIGCSRFRFRTPPPVWLLVLEVQTTQLTPVLRYILWLPVRQRQHVDFKVATLVHRSVSGISPSYSNEPTTAVLSPMLVSDDYVPQRAEHALWRRHTPPSAIEHLQLLDPHYGWNSFPSHLKETKLSYNRF